MLSRKPLEEVNLVCEFSPNIDRNQIRDCQNRDPLLRRIISLVSKEENSNNSTDSLPRRYHQIWDQLKIVDGLLCREYDIEGFGIGKNVVVGPEELKEKFIYHYHDLPSAGHLGWRKTLEKLKK